MPIYEYLCSDCGMKFELLRQLSQANETASCPRCHNPAKRIFSTFASFSKEEGGLTTPIAGSGSSCVSCSAATCDSCGL